jgi:Glycosyl transferase family 2
MQSDVLIDANVAVIMSVYIKDKVIFLKQSIESILCQKYYNFDLFLMMDGPVNENILQYINSINDDRVHVYKRTNNKGLAHSLNELIEIVLRNKNHKYIARMDSDDISDPMRLYKQVVYFKGHKDIDILGSWCYEINEDNRILYLKKLPAEDFELKRNIVKRSPFVHPSVMINRSVFEKGYRYDTSCFLTEDFDLWVRLAVKGFKYSNIQEPLISFRIDNNFYDRRKGKLKAYAEFKCKIKAIRGLKLNIITGVFWSIVTALVKMCPKPARIYIYNHYR